MKVSRWFKSDSLQTTLERIMEKTGVFDPTELPLEVRESLVERIPVGMSDDV